MTSDAWALRIGVDGGATKTQVVVLGPAGEWLGEARGPAATLNGQADSCWARIAATLDKVDAGLSARLSQARIVVGIAGTEIPDAYAQFLATAPACAYLQVVSDAHIARAGAHDLADGAIVAVGTGIVGLCQEQGVERRAGGWGFPHDDRGSGAWLGMEAVAHALAVADGRLADDALATALLAEFRWDSAALASWACQASAGDFARYAPVVVEQAGTGVTSAKTLLRQAGEHVAMLATALMPPDSPLPLALTGSLGSVLAPYLSPQWQARLVPACYNAAHGAARLANQFPPP